MRISEKKFIAVAQQTYMRDDTLALLKLHYVNGLDVDEVIEDSDFTREHFEALLRRFRREMDVAEQRS